MKRSKLMASMLTAAMMFTAVPVQAALADEVEETEVHSEEITVDDEDDEESSDDEIVIEEDVAAVEDIATEEDDISINEEELVEVEEFEDAFEAVEEVAGIPINEDNFPDAIFRSYVAENFDDGDGYLSDEEIRAVTYISVNNMGISSLDGVEFFTGIMSLSCDGNNITSLNLDNPRLSFFNCNNNNMTSLNVENLPRLQVLSCIDNQLTTLDISHNTMISTLGCSNNQITELVLGNKVNYVECTNNPIQSLDIRLNKYLSRAYTRGTSSTSEGCITYSCEYYVENGGTINCQLKTDENVEILAASLGWNKINNNWYFFTDMGILTGWFWRSIPGDLGRYYFDANGVMQTGWLNLNDQWYYFGSNGDIKLGWTKIGNKWYYFNEDTSDVSARDTMKTGWQKIGGKWYYFNSSGAMQTGWQKIDKKWYYFNSSGAMLTGWQKISNKWYYFESSGAMKTGWLKSGGKWYYFESSGAMVTGSRTIGGKVYNFNSSGVCLNP